jgi:hypothetical protein
VLAPGTLHPGAPFTPARMAEASLTLVGVAPRIKQPGEPPRDRVADGATERTSPSSCAGHARMGSPGSSAPTRRATQVACCASTPPAKPASTVTAAASAVSGTDGSDCANAGMRARVALTMTKTVRLYATEASPPEPSGNPHPRDRRT